VQYNSKNINFTVAHIVTSFFFATSLSAELPKE